MKMSVSQMRRMGQSILTNVTTLAPSQLVFILVAVLAIKSVSRSGPPS